MKQKVFFILACFSCSTPREIKTTTELRSGQWVSCWELCGKGDNLIAITESHCKCRKGKSFLHGFDIIKKQAVSPVVEEAKESQSIFEMMGIKPVGQ